MFHNFARNLSPDTERILKQPDLFAEKIVESVDRSAERTKRDTEIIIKDLETDVGKFMNAKAWPFGSRINGLGSDKSDLDIFLDCNNRYYSGLRCDMVFGNLTRQVGNALNSHRSIWTIHEIILKCRVPIIKLTHVPTGIDCDISFTNGMAYEITQLIKTILQKSPLCKKLILFIKQWTKYENLSGWDGISSYAIVWMVIYYLQNKTSFPTIFTLKKQHGGSKIVGGWDVAVSLDFYIPTNYYTFKTMLKGFFKMYAEFDYQNNIICPLMGKAVEKKLFLDPIKCLPVEMDAYKRHMWHQDHRPLSTSSAMLLQEPFNLSLNITQGVESYTLNKFKQLCLLSSQKLDDY